MVKSAVVWGSVLFLPNLGFSLEVVCSYEVTPLCGDWSAYKITLRKQILPEK